MVNNHILLSIIFTRSYLIIVTSCQDRYFFNHEDAEHYDRFEVFVCSTHSGDNSRLGTCNSGYVNISIIKYIVMGVFYLHVCFQFCSLMYICALYEIQIKYV